jgi:hypothetical protein
MSVIISKAFLLADDENISDSTITRQIRPETVLFISHPAWLRAQVRPAWKYRQSHFGER